VVTAACACILFAFLQSKGYRPNFTSDAYARYYSPGSFTVCRFSRGDLSVDVTVAPVLVDCLYSGKLTDSFCCSLLQHPSTLSPNIIHQL
jgi:hypothetical protein